MLTLPRWTGRLRSLIDTLRESYWFLPTIMTIGAALLAQLLVAIDQGELNSIIRGLHWIPDTEPDATRNLLSTIASSTITVSGVTFSILIVALQLASTQFGPRLLRTFLRNRTNQTVLGMFVATYLYSLLVLWSVETDYIPYIATTVALALALTNVFVLIVFLHHAASSIQAVSVINAVAEEINDALVRLFPEQVDKAKFADADAVEGYLETFGQSHPLRAQTDGYVRVIEYDSVLNLAVEHDLIIQILVKPNDFVLAGGLLARVWFRQCASEDIANAVRGEFIVDTRRSAMQDITFLTDQLTEIAVRALSPGVNDPNTAIMCVHRLASVCGRISRRPLPSTERSDSAGVVRVCSPRKSFERIILRSFEPIRRYGIKDAAVCVALLDALNAIIDQSDDQNRNTFLTQYRDELESAFHSSSDSKRDSEYVASRVKSEGR